MGSGIIQSDQGHCLLGDRVDFIEALALDHLKDQDAADRAKPCDPIEAAIRKQWEAMFNQFVDVYADHACVSPIDRAGELFAQDEAWLGNH
jgi:hypothetical protein